MSDDSSDDEAVPPTPPKATGRLNVVLFRKRHRVTVEDGSSSSDSVDEEKSSDFIMKKRKLEKDRDIICVSETSSNNDKSVFEPKRKTKKIVKEDITERKYVAPERESRPVKRKHKDSSRKNNESSVEPKIKTRKSVKEEKFDDRKKRVRKSTTCDECGVTTQNIWRHMIHSHQKNYTKHEGDVVTSGGYVTYICPAPKKGTTTRICGKVEKRLTDHLARSHNIKRGSKRMKTLLARADAVKKETVVEPEETIVISDSEEETVMQPVIKKEVICESKRTQASEMPDLFYRNNAIRDFVQSLTERGSSTAEAAQCGAQAFFVWRRMDPDKTFYGLLDEDALDRFYQTATISVSRMIEFLISVVQFLQFLIKKEYVLNFDIISAKLMIDKISRDIIGFREALSEEEEEHSAYNQEQSNIHTTDSDSENDDQDQRNEPEQQQCSSPVMYMATPINTKNSGVDRNAEDQSEVHSYSYPNRRLLLDNQFKTWLMGFPYLASDSTSSQHVRQAMVIFKKISPRMAVETLFDKSAINGWMMDHLDTMAPGSLLSYLGSLTRALEFLMDTKVFRKEDMECARRMVDHIKVLRKSMKKRVKQRRTVIQTEEIHSMIMPSDIAEFLNCSAVSEIKEKALNPSMEVVPADFFDVRDFLLLRLIQTNAQRPMAVRNITQKTIQKAKITSDGWATMTVAEGKTMESGPVNLGVSPETNCMLKNYLEMCGRIPQFPLDWNRSIFVSFPKSDNTVSEMTSSHVNKAINRIWNLGPIDKPISATKIRKSTSTHVRAAVPGSRDEIARHMSHEPGTADKYYQIYNQRERAKPVCQLIATVMEDQLTEKPISWPQTSTSAKGIDEPILNVKTSIHWPRDLLLSSPIEEENRSPKSDKTIDYWYDEEIVGPPSPLFANDLIDWQEESDREEDITESEEVENKSSVKSTVKGQYKEYLSNVFHSKPADQSHPTHRRRSFTDDESSTLITLCQSLLISGKITRASVMEVLHSTERGRILLLGLKDKFAGKDYYKMITDRIHTERKKRNK